MMVDLQLRLTHCNRSAQPSPTDMPHINFIDLVSLYNGAPEKYDEFILPVKLAREALPDLEYNPKGLRATIASRLTDTARMWCVQTAYYRSGLIDTLDNVLEAFVVQFKWNDASNQAYAAVQWTKLKYVNLTQLTVDLETLGIKLSYDFDKQHRKAFEIMPTYLVRGWARQLI
ncbi:hypothetical protein K470DRAFT_12779 [Piedraia hortae CBS 480.64]|uniref:Uncharacterized protein n=1 Tax=Piedraia hortae CBS 480.64 TaxID=1314780 RepID=A0A6A7BP79_9PEZI|nr:hypothetical protein K470DRAFT_12779 [Piedraia hortae CBS 480.64]